jgi:ketosteroid isomerase-like protein
MRVILAVSTVVALIFGCACTPKAVGDEAGVMATMDEYRRAFLTADVEALLALYSEDWRDHHGSTKEYLKAGYEEMREKASHKGLEVDLSKIEVLVDGDTATVTPVTLSSPEGSITYTHTLKKEADGVWRLIRTETLTWEAFEMTAEERKRKAEVEASALAARNLRERLLSDPHRPGYHFVMPEGIANAFDPNGAIYWKGRYHLFYIFQDKRSGTKLDHWGHISSTDLFHWRHHPTGLLEGMWSGNCFINADGVPTICYHQRGQGNAMAVAPPSATTSVARETPWRWLSTTT